MIHELPFPPSVNAYWRHVGKRVLISEAGRIYAAAVAGLVREDYPKPLTGRLCLIVEAYPPDCRSRDIDNLLKAPLDAMTKAGVYVDDSQIDAISLFRREVVPGGRLVVNIEQIR
jgi:crossover junction endodeoxyribonuclease RusA